MSNYTFPPLYAPWVEELLGMPVPSEERATCHECAMCKPAEIAAPSDYQFNPATKCCAFMPAVPNFLIGSILLDQTEEFANSRANFIKEVTRGVVLPLGMYPPPLIDMFYTIKDFGKSEFLQCPFYLWQEGGLCGIWRYRNAHCFTWFCRYNRGAAGLKFWKELDRLLTAVEKALAKWCVDTIGVQLPENAPNQRQACWGNWAEKEAEFFVECSRMVTPLSWKEALEKAGEEGTTRAQSTIAAFHAMLYESIPTRLKISLLRCESVGSGNWRVWGFSIYDPIDLPEKFVSVLNFFDGRPVNDVLKQIESEQDLKIDPAILSRLVDHKILVSADLA